MRTWVSFIHCYFSIPVLLAFSCIAMGLRALYLYDDVGMIAGGWTFGQSIHRRRTFAILMSCIYLELHDIPNAHIHIQNRVVCFHLNTSKN